MPVLGAVSGAALNVAFLRYYREAAAVRFALLRLAERHGAGPVLDAFAQATTAPRITVGPGQGPGPGQGSGSGQGDR